MNDYITALIGYFLSLAANMQSSAILSNRQADFKACLAKKERDQEAHASARPLTDEVRSACLNLARKQSRINLSKPEKALWRLLTDDTFQDDLIEWVKAGGIQEGEEVKGRLWSRMETALAVTSSNTEERKSQKMMYFDAVEKEISANPLLASWRHQLSLDYLREQVATLRQQADEHAGLYSAEVQQDILSRYCEKALMAWDIIDMSNLPECDIDIVAQRILLRQLYMPLRITLERSDSDEDNEAMLNKLEEQRENRRLREAGHNVSEEYEQLERSEYCSTIGKRLGVGKRLVVLGDPGGGKTTLLRWLATAFLLKQDNSDAYSKFPDTDELPSEKWIPVLIRCRDLGESDLSRSFIDFLSQHLKKSELLPKESKVMEAVILDRITNGEVLLLVDGLDEITNPNVRIKFCRELERTAARYAKTPIVVTSRIVGYRDMPHRIGSGFQHCLISELGRRDKDIFAKRWVAVTEQHRTEAERRIRVKELIDAFHSNERIEHLTGNPMLLTTLALVKRKVGKLPSKRTKLYAEAVAVLLNWNPENYDTIDEDEALPQLEYLAYEMCRRGIQGLDNEIIIELLIQLRKEYPNIRALRKREPEDFLKLLEARSSILIKSGGRWTSEKGNSLWEFRHLTFQEYLAARALINGRFPNRVKGKPLSELVAPLASVVTPTRQGRELNSEASEIPEAWKEALQLLVADCKDDDVDDVVLSILQPVSGEDSSKDSIRPRIALAALCIADEPNISDETAKKVILALAEVLDKRDINQPADSIVCQAALALNMSCWKDFLKKILIKAYCSQPYDKRLNSGVLWGKTQITLIDRDEKNLQHAIDCAEGRIRSSDKIEYLSGTFEIMYAAFKSKVFEIKSAKNSLFSLLSRGEIEAQAAALTLFWLNGGYFGGTQYWRPTISELEEIDNLIELTPLEEANTIGYLAIILIRSKSEKHVQSVLPLLKSSNTNVRQSIAKVIGTSKISEGVEALIDLLLDPNIEVRKSAIQALGRIGDQRGSGPLISILNDSSVEVRRTVIEALGQIKDPASIEPLLSALDDFNIEIKRAVIDALGKIRNQTTVQNLLSMLDHDNVLVRKSVIEALGAIRNRKAVEPLLFLLENSNADIIKPIIKTLGRIGDPKATQPLTLMLESSNPDIRQSAVEALGLIREPKSSPQLLSMLNDWDIEVRLAAIQALGYCKGFSVIDRLACLLDDPNGEIRQAATIALGRLKDFRAIEPLIEMLETTSIKNYWTVVSTLGSFRGYNNVFEAFLKMLDSSNVHMRKLIIQQLGFSQDPRAIEPLIKYLNDHDTSVCIASIRALGALGDSLAVDPLVGMLSDYNKDIILATIESLAHFKDPRAVDSLLNFLTHEALDIRKSAIKALSCIDSHKALNALMGILNDVNVVIRKSVITALANYNSSDVVKTLLELLNDPRLEIRVTAIQSIKKIKDIKAIEPLLHLLDDPNMEIRKSAILALGHIGDSRAVDPLIVQLDDQNDEIRSCAIRALGTIEDIRAIEPLFKMLKDQPKSIRLSAIYTISRLKTASAVEPLLSMLNDQDIQVREAVIKAFWEIKDRKVVEPLLKLLEKASRAETQQALICALRKHNDPKVYETLKSLSVDQKLGIRISAIHALGYADSPDVIEYLITFLSDPEINIRKAVIHILANVQVKQVTEPLVRCLKDPDLNTRIAAINSLGKVGSYEAIGPLSLMLEDTNADVLERVVYALWNIYKRLPLQSLVTELEDSHHLKRALAVQVLGERDATSVSTHFLRMLDDPEVDVRLCVIQILGNLKVKSAVKPLLEMLKDPEIWVRILTIQALGRIGDKRAVKPIKLTLEQEKYNLQIFSIAEVALKSLG